MPKKGGKKKEEDAVPTAPLPAIDEAYVQSVKIQALEDRNSILKAELDVEREKMGRIKNDHADVTQHLQRDLRAKSARIADLQAALRSTQMNMQQTIEHKDAEINRYKKEAEERDEASQAEIERLTEEINDTRLFRERKALMENELAEVRAEVEALKVRHEQELRDLKRDHDLRNAVLHQELEQKITEKEHSIEERAMQRVDAVTKKTIQLNQRQQLEIRNLHKEIEEYVRRSDQLVSENQELRVEVEIKREEVEGAGQRISEIKGVLAQQLEVNEGHAVQETVWKQVSERGDKHTLVLQMMIRTLEDRVAAQGRQIAHYQQRELERGQGRAITSAKSVPSTSSYLPLLPSAARGQDFLNFVNTPQQRGGKGGGGIGNVPTTRRPPAKQGGAGSRRAQVARLVSQGGGAGGGNKDEVTGEVSRGEVISLLLASVDNNPSSGGGSAMDVHPSGAVTHR